jgi:hypothetical protein
MEVADGCKGENLAAGDGEGQGLRGGRRRRAGSVAACVATDELVGVAATPQENTCVSRESRGCTRRPPAASACQQTLQSWPASD